MRRDLVITAASHDRAKPKPAQRSSRCVEFERRGSGAHQGHENSISNEACSFRVKPDMSRTSASPEIVYMAPLLTTVALPEPSDSFALVIGQ
jgi:hypothetical protein